MRREVRVDYPALSDRANDERVMIATIGGTLVVAGAVATLATGSWWYLVLALGAYALVTIAVVGIARVTMRGGEHASPTTVAELQEEGVTGPDRRLSEAAEEFRAARSARDAAG